jgi:hypothetical protein
MCRDSQRSVSIVQPSVRGNYSHIPATRITLVRRTCSAIFCGVARHTCRVSDRAVDGLCDNNFRNFFIFGEGVAEAG